MIRNARALSKSVAFDFAISRAYLDFMLCEAYGHYDEEEAINLLKQVIESKTLNDELLTAANELQERLSTSKLSDNHNKKNLVIPTSSNLPLRSLDGKRVKSYITQKEANAPLHELDDGENYASLGEAVMWYRLCPFSPLCSGMKLRQVFNS
jgi:hypothetical protein